MNENLRKYLYASFFTILLSMLTLSGINRQSYHDFIFAIDFMLILLSILWFLVIRTTFGYREGNYITIGSFIIQLILVFIYLFVSCFNTFFNFNFTFYWLNLGYIFFILIISSLLMYVLAYVFELFWRGKYHFLGTMISFFVTLILYGVIIIPIMFYRLNLLFIGNIFLFYVALSMAFSLILTCLFYILRVNNYMYEQSLKTKKKISWKKIFTFKRKNRKKLSKTSVK